MSDEAVNSGQELLKIYDEFIECVKSQEVTIGTI